MEIGSFWSTTITQLVKLNNSMRFAGGIMKSNNFWRTMVAQTPAEEEETERKMIREIRWKFITLLVKQAVFQSFPTTSAVPCACLSNSEG